jgi:hypothetical protein
MLRSAEVVITEIYVGGKAGSPHINIVLSANNKCQGTKFKIKPNDIGKKEAFLLQKETTAKIFFGRFFLAI